MALPWYATREDAKAELDVKETARANRRIDRALDSASRTVEGLCHRTFYPETATRTFDWPDSQSPTPWRLWLDARELISVTTLSSGGTTIAAADYFLEPQRYGPPFSRLEIDLASSASFGGGDTHQRDITITGLWGYRDDETTAGTLTAAVSSTSATTVSVNGAAAAALGVGSVVRVDSERMLVTGRAMADTGQDVGGAGLTAQASSVTVAVSDGSAFAVDEVLLVESERMLVVDIAGNNLTVKRAWDGSALAAHAAGVDIYASRTLTVTRGALGTTAATHSGGATVSRWDPPGPVRELCLAEAITVLQQGQAGWARTAGSGEAQHEVSGRGLAALRRQVYDSHGRKARVRAV